MTIRHLSTFLLTGLAIFIFSCHPCYKRITRGNWGKDTTWVRYENLPDSIRMTFFKYYETLISKGYFNGLPPIVSLDSTIRVSKVAIYDMNSPKFRPPFGMCFKLGKKKYFIDYSEARTPMIYYENCFYMNAGAYYDPSLDKLRDSRERFPYEKMYYVQYRLKLKPRR